MGNVKSGVDFAAAADLASAVCVSASETSSICLQQCQRKRSLKITLIWRLKISRRELVTRDATTGAKEKNH